MPAETPVTTPLLSTVAIAGFEDVQGVVAFGVLVADKPVVKPTQTSKVPEITGFGLMTTWMLSEPEQPLLSVTV